MTHCVKPRLSFSPIWLVLGVVSVVGAANAEPYIVDAPPSGVELGLGWSGDRAALVPNRCVRFAPIQEGGQLATLDLSEISDSAELRSHLGVSASASVKGIAGEGSASAEFVENTAVSTASTSIAVRATVVNGAMFAGPHKPPALRRFAFSRTEPIEYPPFVFDEPPTDEPTIENQTVTFEDWVIKQFFGSETDAPEGTQHYRFKKGTEAEFREYCGDGYVSGLYSGVEMFSVITLRTADTETAREAKAQISAGFGVAVGSAGVEAGGSETLKKANTQMSFYQRGGARGAIPADRNQLIDKLALIAGEAADAPEFFDIEVTPYGDLPGYPGASEENRPDPRDLVARVYLQLKTFYRDLQAVIDDLIMDNQAKDEQEAAATDQDDSSAEGDDDVPVDPHYERCFPVSRYEALQDKVQTLLRWLERAQAKVEKSDWNYEAFDLTSSEIGTQVNTLRALNDLGLAPYQEADSIVSAPSLGPSTTLLDWLANAFSITDLRINLPPLIPSAEERLCTKENQSILNPTELVEYRQRVMARYIRPTNTRTCQTSASEPDCHSNATLRELEQRIPTSATPQKLDQQSVRGYLCSAITAFPQCVGGHEETHTPSGSIKMVRDRTSAQLLEVNQVSGTDASPRYTLSYPPDGTVDRRYLFVTDQKHLDEQTVHYVSVTDDENSASQFSVRARPVPDEDFGQRILFETPEKHEGECMFSRSGDDQREVYAHKNRCEVAEETRTNYTANAYSWYFYAENGFK